MIDNDQGRVCGHVLAWCSENDWAYICPMQVLMEDMRRTLGATRVTLPDAVEAEQAPPASLSSASTFGRSRAGTQDSSGLGTISNLRIAPATSRVDVAERSGIFQHPGRWPAGSWPGGTEISGVPEVGVS